MALPLFFSLLSAWMSLDVRVRVCVSDFGPKETQNCKTNNSPFKKSIIQFNNKMSNDEVKQTFLENPDILTKYKTAGDIAQSE